MPSAHALLGASSSHRWLNCTPSARLAEQYPRTSSAYADEGTLAHAYGAKALKLMTGVRDTADEDRDIAAHYDAHWSQYMPEFVGRYTSLVAGAYSKALVLDPTAELLVEQRLDFSRWVPGGFGTSDATIASGRMLSVFDLKYGRGVKVWPKDNPQLMIYALGAADMLEVLHGFDTVSMTIVQPRLLHESTTYMTLADLRKWGEEVLRPAALLAWEGKGERSTGDWCKFCPAKGDCETYNRFRWTMLNVPETDGGDASSEIAYGWDSDNALDGIDLGAYQDGNIDQDKTLTL